MNEQRAAGKNAKNAKKHYEKPAIQRVQLHPEESLAAGCKNSVTPGPGGDCLLSSCFGDGS